MLHDRPHSLVVLFVVSLALTVSIVGCDESVGPGQRISLEESDYGSQVVIEVGDEFDVALLANPLHPLVPWEIEVADPSVVDVAWREHETRARPSEDWTLEDDPASTDAGSYLPMTIIDFAGTGLGESEIVLTVTDGTDEIDRYEVTVAVVEDACSYKEGWHMTRVPPRCF